MIGICEHNDPHGRDILVDGPVAGGGFIIRNRRGDIWDGKSWRGMGFPKVFSTFTAAFKKASKMRRVGK